MHAKETIHLNDISCDSKTFEFCFKTENLLQKSLSFNNVVQYEFQNLFKKYSKIEYSQLLKELKGIFPLDLIQLIEKFNYRERVFFKNLNDSYDKIISEHSLSKYGDLPPAHPVNYEWRFTDNSANSITELLNSVNINKEHISCFGTPTIALNYIDHCIDNEVTLIDINEPLLKEIKRKFDHNLLKCEIYDAQKMLPQRLLNKFKIIATNPPWYLDYYMLFTSRAIQLLDKSGGKIYLPLFPALSRHNALTDLLSYYKFLEKSNCKKIKSLGTVEFQTPEFEVSTLVNNNIHLPAGNWRKAELIELTFDEDKKALIENDFKIEKNEWVRFWRNNSSFAISKQLVSNEVINRSINFNLKSQILPTISRSELKKFDISIWYSNNQFSTLENK